MKMRAALYCCDEADQATIEAQERELRLAASQRGWDVAEVFRDRVRKGYSVRHARDALCTRLSMSPADFNIVMVWSISCLAGSLKDLVAIVGLFCSLDQQLFLMFQDVDTTESSGKNWLAAVAMLANFDRQKTIERVGNRVTFARNRSGKILNAKIDPELKARIEKDLRDGKIGQRKIAAKHCVGLGSVKKIKAEAAQNLRANVGLQEVLTAEFGGTAVSGEAAQVDGKEETPADLQIPSARNAPHDGGCPGKDHLGRRLDQNRAPDTGSTDSHPHGCLCDGPLLRLSSYSGEIPKPGPCPAQRG